MSTLVELSRATRLAVTTVSEILRNKPGYSEATRRRVFDAARRLRYRPSMAARQLRGGRSGLLGVLIGLDNPQVNFDRLAQIERAAFAQGFRLMVGQVHEGDDGVGEYLEDFASRGLDGVIWLHQPFIRRQTLPASTFRHTPALVALDEPLRAGGGCVRVDYGAGVASAVAHLRARGRQRIALALAGRGAAGDPMQARLAGYRRSLAAGADVLVWAGDMEEHPRGELIARAILQLVVRGGADAIVASNDLWAAALLKGLKAAGRRVPDDVAIVGFDNLAWCGWTDPALTSIDQQHEVLAAATVKLMARLLAGKPLKASERTVVVTPQLVIRESA